MQIQEIKEYPEDGAKRYRLSYPFVDGKDARAKRINAFIGMIVSACRKDAAAKGFSYSDLRYKITCCEPLSLFFEYEKRGADGAFSYRPFSVTFSGRGYAVFLTLKKADAAKIKRYFRSAGVRFRKKNAGRSYYVADDGRITFFALKNEKRRAKRGVIGYTFTSAEASAYARLFR
ncbi:MAG: hypothetical protein J5879_06470 [Clostridia bacterium]|nr:hypothetical protein [Clostridia bacterium]